MCHQNKLLQVSIHALQQNRRHPQPDYDDLEDPIDPQSHTREIWDDHVLDNSSRPIGHF